VTFTLGFSGELGSGGSRPDRRGRAVCALPAQTAQKLSEPVDTQTALW
jgi:hypothetical protein